MITISLPEWLASAQRLYSFHSRGLLWCFIPPAAAASALPLPPPLQVKRSLIAPLPPPLYPTAGGCNRRGPLGRLGPGAWGTCGRLVPLGNWLNYVWMVTSVSDGLESDETRLRSSQKQLGYCRVALLYGQGAKLWNTSYTLYTFSNFIVEKNSTQTHTILYAARSDSSATPQQQIMISLQPPQPPYLMISKKETV